MPQMEGSCAILCEEAVHISVVISGVTFLLPSYPILSHNYFFYASASIGVIPFCLITVSSLNSAYLGYLYLLVFGKQIYRIK